MINRFLRLGDSRPQTPPDAAACDSGAKIREWMLQMKNTLNLDPSKDTTEQIHKHTLSTSNRKCHVALKNVTRQYLSDTNIFQVSR